MKNGKYVDEYGTKWYKDGELHCDDGPAVEWANGDKEWYINGNRHRIHGPAVIYQSGFKSWWFCGKRHRENRPAIERPNGRNEWYLNGFQVGERDVIVKPEPVENRINRFLKRIN